MYLRAVIHQRYCWLSHNGGHAKKVPFFPIPPSQKTAVSAGFFKKYTRTYCSVKASPLNFWKSVKYVFDAYAYYANEHFKLTLLKIIRPHSEIEPGLKVFFLLTVFTGNEAEKRNKNYFCLEAYKRNKWPKLLSGTVHKRKNEKSF